MNAVPVFRLLVVAAVLAGALGACAQPSPDQDEFEGGPIEVGVLWEAPAPWGALAEEIGSSLEDDYPGTRVSYTFNNTPARPALQLRWLRGDPLDVDLVFEGTDPTTYEWVEEGYLLDLTPYLEEEIEPGVTWKDTFLPFAYRSMQYEGRFYAVPEQVWIWLLQYNQTMFDEWGLEPPETWAEFLDACEKIKAEGVAPIALSGPINFYVGMWYDAIVQRIVGADKVMDVIYGGGKLADDPGFLEAAQEFNKLFERGYIIEGFEGIDFTAVQADFFMGDAAMMFMGSWLVTEMKDVIPPGFELGVATFPAFEGGAGAQDAMFGRTSSWSVAASSDHPELAVEYLRRFTSRETAARRAEEIGQLVPVEGAPAAWGMPGADELLSRAAEVEFILYNYGVGSDTGLRDAWYNPMVELAFGRLTPEQMIAEIDANLEEYRARQASGE